MRRLLSSLQRRWRARAQRVLGDSTVRGRERKDATAAAESFRALHFAVLRDDTARCEQLLAEGADANASENQGRTSLHYAVGAITGFEARAEVIALLLTHGADPAREANDGEQPLVLAARNGFAQSCRLLLAAGAGARLQPRSDPMGALLLSYYAHALWSRLPHYAAAASELVSGGVLPRSQEQITLLCRLCATDFHAGLAQQLLDRYGRAGLLEAGAGQGDLAAWLLASDLHGAVNAMLAAHGHE